MTCDLCKGAFTDDQLVSIGGKSVCAKCKPELVMNLKSGVSAAPRIDPVKAKKIKSRLKRLNLLSFSLAVPGLALQVIAGGMRGAEEATTGSAQAGLLALQGVGAVLWIAGLSFYSRMKGRNSSLGLLGLLSCLGLIFLNYLSKNCLNCRSSNGYSAKACASCGGPV